MVIDMPANHNNLLEEIESFLRQSGMGPSYFGKVSVGNSELVERLRSGRRVWPETADRVREFIADRASSGSAV